MGSGGAAGAMASKGNSMFMTDLAHGNIAEIEAGKMALEKSQNDTVKKFAKQMVDDHTAALTKLQTMAQAKGVKLPEDVGPKHKAMTAALKAAHDSRLSENGSARLDCSVSRVGQAINRHTFGRRASRVALELVTQVGRLAAWHGVGRIF